MTYTAKVILHSAQGIVQNIQQDTVRVIQEIPSTIETEETKEIPHVFYEEADKSIHCEEAEQSAKESAGP